MAYRLCCLFMAQGKCHLTQEREKLSLLTLLAMIIVGCGRAIYFYLEHLSVRKRPDINHPIW